MNICCGSCSGCLRAWLPCFFCCLGKNSKMGEYWGGAPAKLVNIMLCFVTKKCNFFCRQPLCGSATKLKVNTRALRKTHCNSYSWPALDKYVCGSNQVSLFQDKNSRSAEVKHHNKR